MRNYRLYPKQAIIAAMRRRGRIAGDSSFWDITQWPKWWSSGAKELDQSAIGKLVTAPIELPEAVLSSTAKTVQEVPGVVRNVSKAIPIIAVTAGILGVAFLVYKVKGKSPATPKAQTIISGCHGAF
jgi:hypothetical protein